MKHLFIPYELALIAKEKGFDETCLGSYNGFGSIAIIRDGFINQEKAAFICYEGILAPLYQQIVDWFRQKHFIHIHVFFKTETNCYDSEVNIINSNTGEYNNSAFFRIRHAITYYEALNKAILEAFKLI